MSTSSLPYQYVVLRCVPRVDREEFLNVGVVLYCEETAFLEAAWHVDRERLAALDPRLDLDAVCDALAFVEGVCRGDESVGAAAGKPAGTRFGFLKAPRSTVLQTSAVHGGVTTDPARFAGQPWDVRDHVFGAHTDRLAATDADIGLTDADLAAAVAEVPDAWLEPVPGAGSPDELRAAYVSFLSARLATRAWLPGASAA